MDDFKLYKLFLLLFLLASLSLIVTSCGEKNPEELILTLQNSDDFEDRAEAAQELGDRGDQSAVDPLISSLDDEYEEVRVSAAEALGKLKSPEAVIPLNGHLNDANDVTVAVAGALAEIGDPRAIDPLIGTLVRTTAYAGTSEAKGSYEAAKEAIASFGDAAVPSLVKALENETAAGAKEVLGMIGASAAGPLAAVLSGENVEVKVNAVEALGMIDDAAAVQSLTVALQDSSREVRWAAAAALVSKGPEAIGALTAALESRDLQAIADTYSFFIKKGDPATVPVLIEALNAYGNETMGEDYLNCGNEELESAAQAWAAANGYDIVTSPDSFTGLEWGSGAVT